jgi:hypothetical protein
VNTACPRVRVRAGAVNAACVAEVHDAGPEPAAVDELEGEPPARREAEGKALALLIGVPASDDRPSVQLQLRTTASGEERSPSAGLSRDR